jgi:hypothetical protein
LVLGQQAPQPLRNPGTSMISKVKGKTEISLHLADATPWLGALALHAFRSF